MFPSYLEDHFLTLRGGSASLLRSVISINVILHTEGSVATTLISNHKRFLLICYKVTSHNSLTLLSNIFAKNH
jgi:hypothetical protein